MNTTLPKYHIPIKQLSLKITKNILRIYEKEKQEEKYKKKGL